MLIQWTTAFSFAFNADLPVRIQSMPATDPGSAPVFADARLHTFGLGIGDEDEAIAAVVSKVDRVVVFEHNPDPTGYQPFRLELVRELKALGFVRTSVMLVDRASIVVYRRQ